MSDPKRVGSTQSSQNSSPSKDDQTTTNGNVQKKITPRASCWNHFTKFVTKEGEKRARSNTCDVTYTMESTSGSTTNLNSHLKTCLKRPQGNTFNLKQSELAFVKVSQETTDLSTWVFDKDAIRKALVRMIIVDELPFKIVEGKGFKYFLSIACPRFSLPSRWTIRRDCFDLFNSMKSVMKNCFEKDISRVCLTTDTWTSLQRISYMVLTAYWVDDEWRLQKRIINFFPISTHRGESIGQAIENCLRDWRIERVFTITVDNASTNGVAIEYLRKKFNHRNASVANGKFIHMRCVAHILNLIVQYGIKDASVSVDRIRGAMRWNSTYMMLKVAEKYERAFESYVRDNHNFFLDLTAGDGVPAFDDWEIVQRVIKVLEPFYHLTLKVSRSLHVTPHSLFEVLTDVHCLFDGWQDCGDLDIISMTSKMREKYNKYWGEGNKINMLVYLAVIFDLRCEMSFLDFGVNLLFFLIPRFPIPAQTARDILAIPISTVASESAFSTGGRVLDSFRSSLTPLMVETLVCTQDWLRKSSDAINLGDYVDEL
ncbi:hypothetical protein PVK06_024621 [Gossypium arboreum]|uniref:Zinc finger BED domain-containing protein RICESLEEPER 2-like n=1 Tax=Gossypium arboreum TaxID=29729 RepID=A0ABR0PEL0_GOSAR|nr:hypothetical protein PVK06_024621 [Gossypium arboreum]